MKASWTSQSSSFGAPTRKPAAGSREDWTGASAGAGTRGSAGSPGPSLYAAVSHAMPLRRCSIQAGWVGQISSAPCVTFALATKARAFCRIHEDRR